MGHSLAITRRADQDLGEIWDYLASAAGPDVADEVTAAITAEFDRLARSPGIGHRHAHVKNPSYRVRLVHSYLIVYRTKGRTLFISRVVHGRRDLRRLFRR